MDKIKNIESIQSIYTNWRPSDLAFIKKLEWSDDFLSITFLSQDKKSVAGWPDFSKDLYEVSLTFEHPTQLSLNFIQSKIHQLTGFDIIDVSKNGWEDVNFSVYDYEGDTIKFNCKAISIVSVKKYLGTLY